MNAKITVIGGGTGTFTVLKGLKAHKANLSVIVSMMDSGGSNRIIRDEFGLLPTSDIRQCVLALSSLSSNNTLRELFTYRYSKGEGISGMTFGNLFMAALADIHGSQKKAIEKTCEILSVEGNIVPVTYENTDLVAEYENGEKVVGEHDIDEPDEKGQRSRILKLSVFPKVHANPEVITTIKNSDMIVLGPGDLFTSTISNLCVEGVASAISSSRALKVYIVNLMTRHGQTDGFTASEHLKELEKYLGHGVIDVCLVHSPYVYSSDILSRYAKEKAKPVVDDLKDASYRVIRGDFISNQIYEKPKADGLSRSFIRHDSEKLARVLMGLV